MELIAATRPDEGGKLIAFLHGSGPETGKNPGQRHCSGYFVSKLVAIHGAVPTLHGILHEARTVTKAKSENKHCGVHTEYYASLFTVVTK